MTIHTARPGIVIGKKGEDVEKLRKVVADIACLLYTSDLIGKIGLQNYLQSQIKVSD